MISSVTGILCGPKIDKNGYIKHSGSCLFNIQSMPDGPDLGFIVQYYDYVLVFLDKVSFSFSKLHETKLLA